MDIESIKNTVIHGDCLEVMKQMPSECIDLTVTSPPYDNLRNYNGYVFDFEGIATELYHKTKRGGCVVRVVGDATINGSETGTSLQQALYFMKLGFRLHDTMIYEKLNYIPLTHNRYEQAFEYMYVFSKGKPTTFNPIKVKSKGFGNIISRGNTNKTKEGATRNRDEETMIQEDKIHSNIFRYVIGENVDNGNHPAPFPENLAEDMIMTRSNKGDLVFDPFMGSGTTAKMAKIHHRDYLGCEISAEYIDIINKRLECITPSLF